MSLPEVLLWQRFSNSEIGIRRRHPFGRYVLDFYCPQAKLAIEIDGIVHDMGERPIRDKERDAFIRGRGIAVLRIAAAEVLKDVDAAAERNVAASRNRGA
jgi:very-short-patch-repair endonuclease